MPDVHRSRQLIPVSNMPHMFANICVLVIFYIVVRISIAETIHKDLIHNSTFRPFRRRKSGNQAKIKIRIDLFHNALTVEEQYFIRFMKFKIISCFFCRYHKRIRIEIKSRSGILTLHFIRKAIDHYIRSIYILCSNPAS